MEKTLHDLKPACEGVKVEVVIDPLTTVQTNPVCLGVIFQNLISNALKFKRKDGAQVRISARRGQGEWILSVEDNGIGIPEKAKETIFKMFERAHPSKSYSGSGIGLATCKKIVERLGGKIWVESVEGEGSRFHFTIPDPRPAQLEVQIPIEQEEPFDILLVESNAADATIIETLLRQESFALARLHVTRDGEEALSFLYRQGVHATSPRPSLILLALDIPKKDGFAVLSEIKSCAYLKHIPVVILTSSARVEDVERAYELSAACYLTKARDLAGYRTLISLLRQFWLEQVRLPSASPAKQAMMRF